MAKLFKREDRRREEQLSAYVDGELTADDAREVEELLASSEDARRDLAELQATVDLVGQLPELDLPRSFTLDAAPKKRWTMWWPSVRTTGLATSVATILLVGLVAGDMLNVLEQARFGADDSEYASDESAFTDAEAAPASAAAMAVMDAPATPAPEVAAMRSSDQDQPAAAAGVAVASQMAAAKADADEPQAEAAESSEEPVAAMQEDAAEEPIQPVAALQRALPQAFAARAADESTEESAGDEAPQADSQEDEGSPPAAMPLPAAEEAPDVLDDFADTQSEGLELPLAELQIVTAITIVLLTGATLVAVLRRRRSVP